MFLQLESILHNELAFPVLECFHILAFAVAVGTISIVDFRLLGLGLKNQNSSQLAAQFFPWTTLGLGVAFLASAGLFISDPDMYYLNPAFQVKMAFLTLALIFHYFIRPQAVASGTGKWAGIVSLILWSGVVFGGIFIGFTNGEGQ